LVYGGLVLGMSQYLLLPQMLQKTVARKVVKSDLKIIVRDTSFALNILLRRKNNFVFG